ncbi:hypothetical protein ACNPAA_20535, partial [Aeromonas sp. PS2Canimalfood6]
KSVKAILTIKLTAYHRPISICFVGKKLFLIFNKMFTISPWPTAEFTVGEGNLMTHDEPCSMAPDDKHDLISGTCSHLP